MSKLLVFFDLERMLSRMFYNLGCTVGRHPLLGIFLPSILFGLLAFGWTRMTYVTDLEFRYVPQSAIAIKERSNIEYYFPTNYSQIVTGHITRQTAFVDIILTETLIQDENNEHNSFLKNAAVYETAKLIDSIALNNLRISVNGSNITYNDVCAKFNQICLHNDLDFVRYMLSPKFKEFRLYYPRTDDPITNYEYYLPHYFGGIQLSEHDVPILKSAKAFRLSYILNPDVEYTEIWQSEMVKIVQRLNIPNIKVDILTGKSIEKELVYNVQQGLDIMTWALSVLTAFAVFSKLHTGSKIHLGQALAILTGIAITAAAIVSSWGLLFLVGEPMQAINLASIFLLVGVGMDDVFVVLSAWERSRTNTEPWKQLGSCYKEAGTAITISSFTNIGSLCIGILMPGFRSVQIFCKFTAITILFLYIGTLTIFGSSLILINKMEKQIEKTLFLKHRNQILQEKTDTYNDKKSSFKLTGDAYFAFENVSQTTIYSTNITKWVTTSIPRLLKSKAGKLLIIVIFILYAIFASYGHTLVVSGLSRQRLVADTSYAASFFEVEDAYFRENPYRFHVLIKSDGIQFSKKIDQDEVKRVLHDFKNSPYIASNSNFTENWLDIFSKTRKEKYNTTNANFDNEKEYVMNVIDIMNSNPRTKSMYKDWIHINDNEDKIVASRFFFQSSKIRGSEEEMKMITELRNTAAKAHSNFSVTIFNPYQPFWDQFLQLDRLSRSAIIYSGLTVQIMAFFLLPQKRKAAGLFCIALTVFSIALGIQGFMSYLDINKDVISMICLIMATGFSVDYSAHTTYHYLLAIEKHASSSAAIDSIFESIGNALIEAAITTLIPLASLLFLPSYILRSFAKLLCLIILFGIFHGLFVIPVLLSIFTDIGSKLKVNASKNDKQHTNKCKVLNDLYDMPTPNKEREGELRMHSTAAKKSMKDMVAKEYDTMNSRLNTRAKIDMQNGETNEYFSNLIQLVSSSTPIKNASSMANENYNDKIETANDDTDETLI